MTRWLRKTLPAVVGAAACYPLGQAKAALGPPEVTDTRPVGRPPWDLAFYPVVPPTVAPPALQDQPPRPEQLFDLYESRPPFTRALPPVIPFGVPLAPVPAMPPPPSLPAPLVLPEQPNATPPAGGLRQALDEYDRRAGVGGASAVATLSRSMLFDADAWGSATLVVAVDASGTVRAARVLATSRDRPAWDAFAASLRGQRARVRLPPRARAVWATIGVSAEQRNVSGARGNPWASWSQGISAAFDVTRLVGAPQVRSVYATVLSEVWY